MSSPVTAARTGGAAKTLGAWYHSAKVFGRWGLIDRSTATAVRQRGWQGLLTDPAGQPRPDAVTVGSDAVAEPVAEIPVASPADGTVATDDAAQRNLAFIARLDVAPQEAP